MTAAKNSDTALEILCRSAIKQNLGDLSGLPNELVDCVFRVYGEFMTCYLNVLRQKEDRPADWIPPTVSIDAELTDQMRHFFSDYQHITRDFYKLNQDMNRLRAIYRYSHLELYQLAIDEIIERFKPQDAPGGPNEKTA